MALYAFGSNVENNQYFSGATADGSIIPGFEPENVLSPTLSETWKASAGAATRTLTLTYGVAQSFIFVLVVAPSLRPIAGNVTVEIWQSSPSSMKATATLLPLAPGALDRRIAAFNDGVSASIAVGDIVKVIVPAGAEVARVIVGMFGGRANGVELAELASFREGWSIEPADAVTVQRASGVGVFLSTNRLVSGALRKPPRKRRMRFGWSGVSKLINVMDYFRVQDIDELVAIPLSCVNSSATTAQIEAMHATAVYGRAKTPTMTPRALNGGALSDLWDVDFDLEDRV